MHFRDSIFTGSRFALKNLGCSGAHGSYDSVRSFLRNLGSVNTDQLEELGDVNIAFDNNQVLHRQWNVHIESKFRCHMVTMVVAFIIDGTGDLQTKTELKPVNWMQTPSDKDAHVRNIDKLPEVKDTHYDHLYSYLTDVISIVAKEQTCSGTTLLLYPPPPPPTRTNVLRRYYGLVIAAMSAYQIFFYLICIMIY